MRVFIFLLMMLALSMATEVSIYSWNNYRNTYSNGKPQFRSAAPWKFVFNNNDRLYIIVMYRNASPSVADVNFTINSANKLEKWTVAMSSWLPNVNIYQLIGPEVTVNMDLYSLHSLCTSIMVAEGRLGTTVRSEQIGKEYEYPDICFQGIINPCVLIVDLKDVKCKGRELVTAVCSFRSGSAGGLDGLSPQHLKDLICSGAGAAGSSNVTQTYEDLETTTPLTSLENDDTSSSNVTQKNEDLKTTTPLTSLENDNTSSSNVTQKNEDLKTTTPLTSLGNDNTNNNCQQPSHRNVLIYVIPSVVGMCVAMLVIYVTVKKYCLRNSHPGEALELNTYATAGEVVYAELNLTHGDSRSSKPDEESPYAEVIGVLHPHSNKTILYPSDSQKH